MCKIRCRMRTACRVLLVGLALFASQPASDASASTIIAGSFIQFEIHSNENHSFQTLDGIDLSFGSFDSTNLMSSSLIAGIFVQTIFTNANMQDVDLTDADLTDAVFNSGTILRNADLTGANLVGIDLTGVNVQNAIFIGALYDATSILPFDPVAAGLVLIPEQSPITLMAFGLMMLATLKRPEHPRPLLSPSPV